jgi:hypothetical protein
MPAQLRGRGGAIANHFLESGGPFALIDGRQRSIPRTHHDLPHIEADDFLLISQPHTAGIPAANLRLSLPRSSMRFNDNS